ncbi:hypothetical protein C4D60_Mb08t19070 [Musa balbisiana]|uniref:Sof1-like protein domain-containing protein n=1 Tax=Musa balbisiana TaxID=52838 RepID=A0A4S8K509_MUSBA|nr:hypothetical protein C4D60_Mb08t19070 [Musa balbisiana]
MKVKVISRSTEEFTRERSQDLQKVFRNYDPKLRTHEKAVEYTRALNAAKLEKIFARPFIGAMDGHIDAVSCMAKNPNHLKGIFSGSMDGDIRLWDIATRAVDHQWDGPLFATAGSQVDIWDHNSDRSITLYDLRMSSPVRKLIMRTKTNAICWNPMEPMNFTAANEDCSCYSYDTRKLDEAKVVHKDHVSAVCVTVFCVRYSCDGSYLISGSDDTNLRLWKAKSSEQMGVKSHLMYINTVLLPHPVSLRD